MPGSLRFPSQVCFLVLNASPRDLRLEIGSEIDAIWRIQNRSSVSLPDLHAVQGIHDLRPSRGSARFVQSMSCCRTDCLAVVLLGVGEQVGASRACRARLQDRLRAHTPRGCAASARSTSMLNSRAFRTYSSTVRARVTHRKARQLPVSQARLKARSTAPVGDRPCRSRRARSAGSRWTVACKIY